MLGFFVGHKLDLEETRKAGGYRRVRPMSQREFADAIDDLLGLYDPAITQVQLNLLDSHDTPRFITCARGDESALRLATLFMFTYPGAPCIYYGDEIGLDGRHDPDCRRLSRGTRAAGITTCVHTFSGASRCARRTRRCGAAALRCCCPRMTCTLLPAKGRARRSSSRSTSAARRETCLCRSKGWSKAKQCFRTCGAQRPTSTLLVRGKLHDLKLAPRSGLVLANVSALHEIDPEVLSILTHSAQSSRAEDARSTSLETGAQSLATRPAGRVKLKRLP